MTTYSTDVLFNEILRYSKTAYLDIEDGPIIKQGKSTVKVTGAKLDFLWRQDYRTKEWEWASGIGFTGNRILKSGELGAQMDVWVWGNPEVEKLRAELEQKFKPQSLVYVTEHPRRNDDE